MKKCHKEGIWYESFGPWKKYFLGDDEDEW